MITNASSLAEPALRDIGLGPTTHWFSGYTQNALEMLHVDLGLEWWSAIVVGTIALRTLTFPLMVYSQKNAAVMANNMPQMQAIQQKMTQARTSGNNLEG